MITTKLFRKPAGCFAAGFTGTGRFWLRVELLAMKTGIGLFLALNLLAASLAIDAGDKPRPAAGPGKDTQETAATGLFTSAQSFPTDEPYLSDSRFLPPGVTPDPLHNLVAVREIAWANFPPDLANEYFGTSAAQRVIYRDTLTGAEVWLMARSPKDEEIGYTNWEPFNANGSLIRIWTELEVVRSDGSGMKKLKDLIPGDWVGLPAWSRTDPDAMVCTLANGGRFEFNLKTGERRDLFMPDAAIPPGTDIQFSDDGKHSLFRSKQGARGNLMIQLGDANGKNRKNIKIKSASRKPEDDRMGSVAFLRDQYGTLYIRYSLNKKLAAIKNDPNPYQNYLVDLDGQKYRPVISSSHTADDGGPKLYFIPAGDYVVTGHGGYSPSKKYSIHHLGYKEFNRCKWIQAVGTEERREIARIPGCDHMDWSVDNNWFYTWAVQPGTPIYKCYVDSGMTERIVSGNACPHGSGNPPYHGESPDGTKLVYKSRMLGSFDVFMAIVRPPAPPDGVTLARDGKVAVLKWQPPGRHKEIAGYNVYRSDKSGRGYERINAAPVAATSFRDDAPPENAFYALTSVEHSGLEGRVFSPEVSLADNGPISRYLEAEDASLTFPMREIFLPAECSANHAITRAARDAFWEPAAGTGKAVWNFDLPREGVFSLWARLRRTAGEKNQLEISLAGTELKRVADAKPDWGWTSLASGMKLPNGKSDLSISLAEPGLEIDKLLLTSDNDFIPEKMGNAPNIKLRAVEDLTVQRDEKTGFMLLRWKPSLTADKGFHHYQIYRGITDDFTPSQRHLIGSPTRAMFIDPGPLTGGMYVYRVSAVDTWDNESESGKSVAITSPIPPPAALKPQAISVMIKVETNVNLSGGARLRQDASVEGGRYVSFGEPNSVVEENLGEAQMQVAVAAGEYCLWLRVRGDTKASYCFVGLGNTTNYCILNHPLVPSWQWRRVISRKTTRTKEGQVVADRLNPQEQIARYKIGAEPVTLSIRHRANYMAVDRFFITTDAQALPEPGADEFHQGCNCVFKRKQ